MTGLFESELVALLRRVEWLLWPEYASSHIWHKIAYMQHQEQDARSLALHAAAIELMRADESLIQQALDILARWDTHVSIRSKPLRDEWVRILRERDWDVALSTSERGNQLRQASPVSCVLPTERRLEIIRATSKHRDQSDLLSLEQITKASARARSVVISSHDHCD